MLKAIPLLSFFVASLITVTSACGGCSLQQVSVKPCPGSEKTNVIHIGIESLTLGSDCIVRPKGWMNVTKTVKELQANWQFQKGVMRKNGESDGCKELEEASKDKEAGMYFQLLGFPKNCPIEKGHTKIQKEVDVSKYKDKMRLASGPSSGKVDVSHGDGTRTCYTYDATVDCKGGA